MHVQNSSFAHIIFNCLLFLPTTVVSCCDEIVAPTDTCASNPTCNLLGLTGVCCPTIEGVFLDCCDEFLSSDNPAPECSAHAACSGLAGECCPTQVRIVTS